MQPRFFYATVINDKGKVGLMAGPFASEAKAREWLPAARKAVDDFDPRAPWYAYGAVGLEPAPGKAAPRGVLNARLEVPAADLIA